MARRIKKESIELLKSNIRIGDVLEWLGVRMQPSKHMAWCPFCADAHSRHPGLSYDDRTGLYHCFVCQRGGDMISFASERLDLNFGETVERLAAQFNIPLEYDESDDGSAESANHRLMDVLDKANEIFKSQRVSPKFRKFISDRGIAEAAIDRFELGMSDSKWADAVIKRLIGNGVAEESLVECGLCTRWNDGSIHLRYIDRVMFPIRAANGDIVGFGGRDVTGKASAKYTNSPETPLFRKRSVLYGFDKAKRHISRSKRVLVCEGYMDTIALQMNGFPYAVGAMGTALTERNIEFLANRAERIYISLDADKAGMDAAMRVADNANIKTSSRIFVVTLPRDRGKDPDEFFNSNHGTTAEFEGYIDNGVPLMTYCAMRLLSDSSDKINGLLMSSEKNSAIKITDIRTDTMRRIDEFMSKHYNMVVPDERREIAISVIDALNSSESPDAVETRWHNASKTNRRVIHPRAAEQHPSFSSSLSADEDKLILFLYENPARRGELKKFSDEIDGIFTSETRRSLYGKMLSALSRGVSIGAIQDDLDASEINELSRITLDGNIERSDDLEHILTNARRNALQRDIRQESESAEPDFMRLIALRKQLAALG